MKTIILFLNIVLVTISLILWEIYEYHCHIKRRSRLKRVIHVNGTRGKSSVTRLICFALKEAGFNVIAKTTGAIAQIISVDNSVRDISRIGKANIGEQVGLFKKAILEGADTVVVECMAVDPQFQRISEEKIIQSDLGVITNVRDDHREIMGPSRIKIAESLSGTIPRNKAVFTSEGEFFDIIHKKATEKNSRAYQARSAASVSDSMMHPFPYLEHRENVALALDVCKYFGINEDTALKGMYKTIPDPGALKTYKFTYREKWFEYANAFSANDPLSTVSIWNRLSKRFQKDENKICIFCSRKDRSYRSVDMSLTLASLPVDLFLVIGTGTGLFCKNLIKYGVPHNKICVIGYKRPAEIFDYCYKSGGLKNFVFCSGNIVGLGMDLMNYVEKTQLSRKKES